MSRTRRTLRDIFDAYVQSLTVSLQPATVKRYRIYGRDFLKYLQSAFPQVQQLSQLRRDPHLLGWFSWLCERQPPLGNAARSYHLICLRRLFQDLATNGHPIQPDLIVTEDLPPIPRYLPRALSLRDDELLQQELRRTGDLPAQALLLLRATGIRIGECMDLAIDCMRQLGPDQWALHVPLGKLQTERLVPVDQEVHRIMEQIRILRTQSSPKALTRSEGLLLPRSTSREVFRATLGEALAGAAQRAGCFRRITPHQLRHYAASGTMPRGSKRSGRRPAGARDDCSQTIQDAA
jgi:site-specific recombinase XerD